MCVGVAAGRPGAADRAGGRRYVRGADAVDPETRSTLATFFGGFFGNDIWLHCVRVTPYSLWRGAAARVAGINRDSNQATSKYAAQHAPGDILYSVPMLVGC